MNKLTYVCPECCGINFIECGDKIKCICCGLVYKKVDFKIYGKDNILSVSEKDSILSAFNEEELEKIFHSLKKEFENDWKRINSEKK